MPQSIDQKGLSLVEAAVAVAVVAILAGAMVPLVQKGLNQRRESRTRDLMRLAFLGMFGALDHREANLRADIGFSPSASLSDLSILLSKAGSGGAWAGVRDFGKDDARGLFWGYNGPYWHGPVVGGLPVDAWGRPLRLVVAGTVPNLTWQVRSNGANGLNENGAGDDLAYPASPADSGSFTSVLNLNLQNPGAQSVTVVGYSRNPAGTALQVVNHVAPLPAASTITLTGARTSTVSFNPVSGGFVVALSGGGTTLHYLFDLGPGETRDALATFPPGLCTTSTVPFNRSGNFPNENVTILLSWGGGSQTQTVVAQFNNGHPEGVPPPAFTNLPQGVEITALLTSDRRGPLGSYPFTLTGGCTTPTITF